MWLLLDAQDLLGRAARHHLAALLAAFRTHVDDPVGRLDHVQLMLDHHHRVAQIHQPLQHVQQLA